VHNSEVDPWIREPLWAPVVSQLDDDLAGDLSNVAELAARIPIRIFGQILLDPPQWLPKSGHLLPKMPPDEIQIQWTGSAGETLLRQSVDFIRCVVAAAAADGIDVRTSRALDFGAGWGRLTRLWLKYAPPSLLQCCDAWEQSLQVAEGCSLLNTMVKSDPLLEALPFPASSFDIVWAFSVLTHLSPLAFNSVVAGVARMLRPRGIFVFTVRPDSYWSVPVAKALLERESNLSLVESNGIKYLQHAEENPHFGETSVSMDYLERTCRSAGLEVEQLDWSLSDPYQMVIVVRR
jgi:2-polyprenyl-3-methyl-5-hydroxy-6-metoxy-1,4-benzoquinol methylase